MKTYFIQNPSETDNRSVRVKMSPSEGLENQGPEGATVIEGDTLTTCLAPTTVTINEPEAFKSDIFELSEDNKYVVEVNGVVVPFIFTPDQLPLYFDGSEARPSIQFKEYVKPMISCVGAGSSVTLILDLYWNGESGGSINFFDDETNEGIGGVQGYYVNLTSPISNTMAKVIMSSGTTSVTCDEEPMEINWDGPQNHFRQKITFINNKSAPLRLRADVYYGFNNEWSETKVTMAAPNNPTFVVSETTANVSVSKVCLAQKLEIACAGAGTSFNATTSLEPNNIEIQVNGGEWKSIPAVSEISVIHQPGNPGAKLAFELNDDRTPKRIRLRTTRDIGLYVNPDRGIDQIISNKAYVLYDREGNFINPRDSLNYVYGGTEFDDPTTTQDFAIFFASAEFCLSEENSQCSVLPTSIPNTFPEFHMFANRKPYVLTVAITEAGVTRTQKVTLDHTNSNFQGSEATIFKRMMGAIGLSKLGTPGESWTPIYGLVDIQPQSTEEVGKILGFGYGNEEEPWYNVIEGGNNPVNISFLPTTSPGTATDLYSFINTTDVVHSCGWSETGNAVGVFTDEDAYFRPAFITIEDVT